MDTIDPNNKSAHAIWEMAFKEMQQERMKDGYVIPEKVRTEQECECGHPMLFDLFSKDYFHRYGRLGKDEVCPNKDCTCKKARMKVQKKKGWW